jgi:hypothetical protein
MLIQWLLAVSVSASGLRTSGTRLPRMKNYYRAVGVGQAGVVHTHQTTTIIYTFCEILHAMCVHDVPGACIAALRHKFVHMRQHAGLGVESQQYSNFNYKSRNH